MSVTRLGAPSRPTGERTIVACTSKFTPPSRTACPLLKTLRTLGGRGGESLYAPERSLPQIRSASSFRTAARCLKVLKCGRDARR